MISLRNGTWQEACTQVPLEQRLEGSSSTLPGLGCYTPLSRRGAEKARHAVDGLKAVKRIVSLTLVAVAPVVLLAGSRQQHDRRDGKARERSSRASSRSLKTLNRSATGTDSTEGAVITTSIAAITATAG